MKDEALKLALEALEVSVPVILKDFSRHGKAITAIKEALAQQDSKDKEQAKTDSFVRQLDEALEQPEPWEKFCDSYCVWTDHHPDCKFAERLPLTDEELRKLADKHLFYQPEGYEVSGVFALARAIEAAHGIKGEA